MGVRGTPLHVWMEGLDEPLVVQVDQRDYAAWAAYRHTEGDLDSMIIMVRYLAWNAGKRQGKLSVAWKEFNDRLCIEALDPSTLSSEEEEEKEGEQGLDPGRKTAGASS